MQEGAGALQVVTLLIALGASVSCKIINLFENVRIVPLLTSAKKLPFHFVSALICELVLLYILLKLLVQLVVSGCQALFTFLLFAVAVGGASRMAVKFAASLSSCACVMLGSLLCSR